MAKQNKIYTGITTVFVLAVLMYLFLPDTVFFQTLAAIPAFGALLAALFLMVRDYLANERAHQLLHAKNHFIIGASSHMANVAFDKHVEFAEEYVKEAQETLRTLFREGPTAEMLKHSGELYAVQEKYVVWLTDSIEQELEKFESALRKIGAAAHLEDHAGDMPGKGARIEEMYKTFAEVIGEKTMGSDEWEGEKLSEDRAVSMLIRRLRSILGTEELTQLRRAIVTKAAADSNVKDKG